MRATSQPELANKRRDIFKIMGLISTLLLTACGGSRKTVQLPPQPIAYADTLPIERPASREVNQVSRLLQNSVGGEIGHAFSLRRMLGADHEAINVTRFDGVVNSSWFENRIGRVEMSPQEVARGPTTVGPDTSRALRVIAGKAAGISPGFTVRDARGDTYLFKFDPRGNLHLASAAGVIASRLFHAVGYHTPEDYIVVFDSARLELDPEAEIEIFGRERPMTEDDFLAVLDLTDPLPDGRFLALASKFVPGRPLDPFLLSGVRGDDPNDYYHHQYRRELRGLYVISSWLNHVDMRYENTLDVFIDPPGYVRHYLIDFAASLGSGTIRPHNPREGKEYNFDLWPTMGRVFTLGFYKQGWEEVEFEQYHPSIGWMRAESFSPHDWKPNWPNAAFRAVTPADGYWAAKIVGAFGDAHIRAAVAEGALPNQEASDILAGILGVRRDKIVAYWYAGVTPLENAEARLTSSERGKLQIAFDDLGLEAGLWESENTSYTWKLTDAYLGIDEGGQSAAVPGTRQALEIRLGSYDSDAPSVGEAVSTGTLRVKAVRNGKRVGREASVLLRWDGAAAGYTVVGIRH